MGFDLCFGKIPLAQVEISLEGAGGKSHTGFSSRTGGYKPWDSRKVILFLLLPHRAHWGVLPKSH